MLVLVFTFKVLNKPGLGYLKDYLLPYQHNDKLRPALKGLVSVPIRRGCKKKNLIFPELGVLDLKNITIS